MRIKRKLPDAPEPTRAVRIIEKPDIESLREVDEKYRARARENAMRNNPRAWTTDEMKIVRHMIREGSDIKDIAMRLPRRTESSVDAKIRSMRKKGEL